MKLSLEAAKIYNSISNVNNVLLANKLKAKFPKRKFSLTSISLMDGEQITKKYSLGKPKLSEFELLSNANIVPLFEDYIEHYSNVVGNGITRVLGPWTSLSIKKTGALELTITTYNRSK